MQNKHDNSDTSWGDVAGWYDELLLKDDDSYQAKVIMPNLLRIVDPKPNMVVADIACGQGFFSRVLSPKVKNVIASDISEELIQKAKGVIFGGRDDKGVYNNISYHVSSAKKLPFIETGSVDVAIIVLAIQNIRDYVDSIIEASRILNNEGRLILIINHPAFRIPGESDWQYDDNSQYLYRCIRSYMSEKEIKINMNPGKNLDNSKKDKSSKYTISFHRPLQSYFKAFNKAGLKVSKLEEWISHKTSQNGPRKDVEDRSRKEFPMFMAIVASK